MDGLANYVIMAATVTEVEIDVLTGMHQIRRCDFIEDTGLDIVLLMISITVTKISYLPILVYSQVCRHPPWWMLARLRGA